MNKIFINAAEIKGRTGMRVHMMKFKSNTSSALCLSCQHGAVEIQSRDWYLVLGFICGLTHNPVGRFKYIKCFVMDKHI